MSAPSSSGPNQGIVGQAAASVQNAVNYVSDTIAGKSSEASAEANKTVAQGDTNASLGNRAQAAGNFIGDKLDQKKNEASAEANKQSI